MLLETLQEWEMGLPVGLRQPSDLGGGLEDGSLRACTAFTKDQSSVLRTHSSGTQWPVTPIPMVPMLRRR